MNDHSSAVAPLQWKFSQVIGQPHPNRHLQDDDDLITAVAFENCSDHLAIGDCGGRVIIFEKDDVRNNEHSRKGLEQLDSAPSRHPKFQYKTELQSHEPEFDYPKSVEIEGRINKITWCMTHDGLLFILSTDDKTIKLWKVKEHKVKKVKEMAPLPCSENMLLAERSFISGQETRSAANGHHLEWKEKMPQNLSPSQDITAKIAGIEDTVRTKCRKVYAYAHSFNINSISNNSGGETFISADDLGINLWNLAVSDQCFNIIDMKPSNMEGLTEIITSSEFHPLHCNLLAYSSSRGFIRVCDLRHAAICDHSSRIFKHGESSGSKSFFAEIIASISDIKFLNDGRHLISRGYMDMKLWDMRMESSPLAIFKIHEHLRPKLPELYNNYCIFDKFEYCFSGDGLHFATGSNRKLRKPLHQAASRFRRPSLSNLITRGLYQHGWRFIFNNDIAILFIISFLHHLFLDHTHHLFL